MSQEPAAGRSQPTTPELDAANQQFTFRKFIETLSTLNLHEGVTLEVDVHWTPQYRFLGNTELHFLGRFQHLADDMATIAARLGIATPLPEANRTHYVANHELSNGYADWPVARLRKRGIRPAWPELVANLYERDITQFGYDF